MLLSAVELTYFVSSALAPVEAGEEQADKAIPSKKKMAMAFIDI